MSEAGWLQSLEHTHWILTRIFWKSPSNAEGGFLSSLLDFPPHSSAKSSTNPFWPQPLLAFQDSPCRTLPHPNILEALNYPSVPYAFDHTDLSIENVLPLLSAHEVLE